MQRVLFLCVHYDSPEALRAMLGSLRACETSGVEVDVLIVDNSVENRRLDQATVAAWGAGLDVVWKAPQQNLGYYGGGAWGLRDYLSSHETPDWTVVCNVDLIYRHDFIMQLTAQVREAVIAPRIRHAGTGADENPYMVAAPGRSLVSFYCWLYKRPALYAVYQQLARAKRLLGAVKSATRLDDREIYAPHGACIVFPRDYFARGGTLDHPLFLYGEEFFVAETARRVGVSVKYVPALVVMHDHGVSTDKLARRARLKHVLEATEFYRRTYLRQH